MKLTAAGIPGAGNIDRLGGMLNEKSQALKAPGKQEYLRRDQLEKNPKNPYEISDIETLAFHIREYGLVSPLDVKRIGPGKYMLLGGERRLTAIDLLIKDPEAENWNEDTFIPVVIKDPDEIRLPLSSEAKEMFAIIGTNRTSRKNTEADTLNEMREWKKIITELRENGETSLQLDEERTIGIKGEKTRDILATTMGVSRGKINQMEAIENSAIPELKDAIDDNRVSINVAADAARRLSEEQQEDLIRSSADKDRITKNDVDSALREIDKVIKPEPTICIPRRELNGEIHSVMTRVPDPLYMTPDQLKKFKKAVKNIEKILLLEPEE